jgi:hypothetical protein
VLAVDNSVVEESTKAPPIAIDFNNPQKKLLYYEEPESAAFSETLVICSVQVRDQEAGGSNPLAPTNPFNRFGGVRALARLAL